MMKLLSVLIILVVLVGIVDGGNVIRGNTMTSSTLQNCDDTFSDNKVKMLNIGSGVSGSGTPVSVCSHGCDCSGLQAAINKVVSGGIIEVHAGTYSEDFSLTKPLKFKSIGGPVNYEGVIETNNYVATFDGNGYYNHFASIVCKISGITAKHSDLSNQPSQEHETISIQKLLYSDDFSDINSGWPKKPSDPKVSNLGYKNGEYFITVFQKNKATSAWLTSSFGDFVIEVETTQKGGPDDNDYGIILRRIDKDNYYRFKISGTGYYGFDKWQDGEWTDIIPWTRSTAINNGMATNLMKAECNGDKFTFYANGDKLGDCSDHSFASGNIGLIAGTHDEGGVKISFDNLKVWAIN
jgi:hypothetical protein